MVFKHIRLGEHENEVKSHRFTYTAVGTLSPQYMKDKFN